MRAVVFDFDGLILDSEGPAFTSWQEAFAAHGCPPLTIDEWGAEIGTAGHLDLVAILEARATTPVDVDAMQTARRARRDELLAAETTRPGVEDWLDAADAGGFALAIASSSSSDWVLQHLERLGLRERFAFVSCCDGDVAAKPAPDVYEIACAAIGVAPQDALAVEDSPHGITAAQAAGLRCVAVPHAITEQLDISHADLVLRSLAEIPLGAVVERLAAR